jgi:hypothetical protein
MTDELSSGVLPPDHVSSGESRTLLIPAFERAGNLTDRDNRRRFQEACMAWLTKSPSSETRSAYSRELNQFLQFAEIPVSRGLEQGHIRALARPRARVGDRGESVCYS